ncbi:MAG: AAA family ATPase [Erysipelotrichaceae bacterium]|nr:AAA family ATPase [Erysipelotrichaceae bacterium]
MNNRDRKREEKERLMEEVLGKSRSYEQIEPAKAVELSFDSKKKMEDTADTLKNATASFNSLKAILEKQQKDLEAISRDTGLAESFSVSEMERMRTELQNDYGVKNEPVVEKPSDMNAVFDEVEKELETQTIVNKDTQTSLIHALRRPYVMGTESGKAKNVAVITGSNGSCRHETLSLLVKDLYHKQALLSDEIYTIDMSLYQSGSQEQIFLQDLYQALNGRGEIICFENFETGFPAYLRMLESLVCDGKIILNKRYVFTKGILVENQTGLVKEAIDSLSADGKYLIFVTTGGTKAIQNSFGANFLYHVLDIVSFDQLSEEQITKIIEQKIIELEDKAKKNLKFNLKETGSLKEWILQHYDKMNGADGITALFDDFYVSLSQMALDNKNTDIVDVTVTVLEDKPVAVINDNKTILVRSKTSSKEIEAVNKEMDEIVGLVKVKDYVRSLQSHIRMQELRREQGMKVSSISKHMIFTGNPGTGKTTIARLLARYMKAIGALSKGQLVEVTRADLVAKYVGQTAPLTMSVIKSAIGGVLFIDEAYSLYRGNEDSFGLECIDTIVKAMEDNRDDLIVILAGYKKEMEVFLESNSGLKSRFPNLIDFPDYTGEELQKIAVLQAKGKGYVISEEAYLPLQEYFTKVQEVRAAEAGNGRLARNIVEEAILKQSNRLVENPSQKLDELRLEDFDLTNI